MYIRLSVGLDKEQQKQLRYQISNDPCFQKRSGRPSPEQELKREIDQLMKDKFGASVPERAIASPSSPVTDTTPDLTVPCIRLALARREDAFASLNKRALTLGLMFSWSPPFSDTDRFVLALANDHLEYYCAGVPATSAGLFGFDPLFERSDQAARELLSTWFSPESKRRLKSALLIMKTMRSCQSTAATRSKEKVEMVGLLGASLMVEEADPIGRTAISAISTVAKASCAPAKTAPSRSPTASKSKR